MADKVVPVNSNEVVCIEVQSHAGATLPQLITAMLRIARTNQCSVRCSTWNPPGSKETATIMVMPDDTYQGAQRKVQRIQAKGK